MATFGDRLVEFRSRWLVEFGCIHAACAVRAGFSGSALERTEPPPRSVSGESFFPSIPTEFFMEESTLPCHYRDNIASSLSLE